MWLQKGREDEGRREMVGKGGKDTRRASLLGKSISRVRPWHSGEYTGGRWGWLYFQVLRGRLFPVHFTPVNPLNIFYIPLAKERTFGKMCGWICVGGLPTRYPNATDSPTLWSAQRPRSLQQLLGSKPWTTTSGDSPTRNCLLFLKVKAIFVIAPFQTFCDK